MVGHPLCSYRVGSNCGDIDGRDDDGDDGNGISGSNSDEE